MSSDDKETERPYQQTCLFCRIAHHQEPNSRVLFDEDGIVIFKDIHPASEHHYLVIPKFHVKNPKQVDPEDLNLVEKLVTKGKEFLQTSGGDIEDCQMGFHWPPFNSIAHLHLHVISPVSSMGFISSLIFKPGTLWFVTAEWLLNRLKTRKLKK